MAALDFLNERIFGIIIPFLLIGVGIYFCVRLRFFHFLHPVKTARAMLSYEKSGDGESPLRALSMALAGTLGVGNITGVALAICVGGAGAVFWMWVSALAAMIIRYAEIVLALDCRVYKNGGFSGSAMQYIKSGVGGRAGAALATVFAFLCLLCSFFLGGIIQSNVIAECFSDAFGAPTLLVGAGVGLLSFLAISGGAKKISTITAKIVPIMTVLYIIVCIFVIVLKFDGIGEVIRRIFSDAFSFRGVGGGALGFFLSDGVRAGVSRGLISNEAGCGTAPMAHATSGVSHPSKQGLLGIFEVFVDTVLLCSLTAFVILLNYDVMPTSYGEGMTVVMGAFSSVFGRGAEIIISVAIFFFAFATIICWAYYGQSCASYFMKSKKGSAYSFVFCISLFFGAMLAPDFIWGVTDIIISLMTLINIFALITKADRVVTLSAELGLFNSKIKALECERKAERQRSKDALSCR